MSGTESV